MESSEMAMTPAQVEQVIDILEQAARDVDVTEILDLVNGGVRDIKKIFNKIAQLGYIELFYTLIPKHPTILERFDKDSFCETPLHAAAQHGRTHFAMEMVILKPSLAWKLNETGLSPMHLALQHVKEHNSLTVRDDYFRLVRGLVAFDGNIIRVKGRGGITPLHYVAQIGYTDLMGEFLYACPSSVEDLTTKCETAMHIAVKNEHLYAFKVLLGWLKRDNREDILNWKDEDGNTVFHIATSTNQIEVMKLLRPIIDKEAKNFKGETAKDIYQSNRASLSPEMRKTLSSKTYLMCLLGVSSKRTNLAVYLSGGLSLMEKQTKLLKLNNISKINGKGSSDTNSDYRNILIVVVALIATATYQAMLTPPGGYWQDDSGPTIGTEHAHRAGQVIMPSSSARWFYYLNLTAFSASVTLLMLLIVGLPIWKSIGLYLMFLELGICYSVYLVCPSPVLIIAHQFAVASLIGYVNLLIASFKHDGKRRRVEIFKGCME